MNQYHSEGSFQSQFPPASLPHTETLMPDSNMLIQHVSQGTKLEFL